MSKVTSNEDLRIREYIGERLRFIREKKGIKQSVLAKKIGIAGPTLSNIENGNVNPKMDTLNKILTQLGVRVLLVSDDSEQGADTANLRFVNERKLTKIVERIQELPIKKQESFVLGLELLLKTMDIEL